MRLNKMLLTLLLVLIPSAGWGMDCELTGGYYKGDPRIWKCIDEGIICYTTIPYDSDNISCIYSPYLTKNQEVNND